MKIYKHTLDKSSTCEYIQKGCIYERAEENTNEYFPKVLSLEEMNHFDKDTCSCFSEDTREVYLKDLKDNLEIRKDILENELANINLHLEKLCSKE